jgi:hypothetical protein
MRAPGVGVRLLVSGILLAAACQTASAQSIRTRPATFNDAPIVLSGSDTLVIEDADYTIKNTITLRGSSTLIIRNSTFTHAADVSGQYALWAYDKSRVIIENSTLKTIRPFTDWHFLDDASLQMSNVNNMQSTAWSGFQQRAHATAVNVARFFGTVSDQATFDVDRATEAFIETVYPPGATVDEHFPSAVGAAPYQFPNDGEQGVAVNVHLTNIGSAKWGITYVPEDNITISDTDSLVVTFNIPQTYSGLTARFDNVRAQRYADQTWTTGNATLHLRNTTTERWSPIVSGDNTLVITNSDLADNYGSYGHATVSVADSSMTYVRTNDFVRFTIDRTFIAGDAVAGGNSILTLTDSAVGGRVVAEDRGVIVATGVVGLGRGFILGPIGSLTAAPSERISGRMSIKGSYSGPQSFNPYLSTDASTLKFERNRTYRIEFKYQILAAPSKGFEVLFISGAATAAGNFLPSITINGRAGESGTATLTARLGAYDDYRAIWNVTGTGAIVVDDVRITDVDTGRVVASEGADTPVTVEQR